MLDTKWSPHKTQSMISDCYWLRNSKTDEIPADCWFLYSKLRDLGVKQFQTVIDDIHSRVEGGTVFPMTVDPILRYLDGCNISFVPFCHRDKYGHSEIEGYREADPSDPYSVTIYYNESAPLSRQTFTKIHELFHFMQQLDSKFMFVIDKLIEDKSIPVIVIHKLLERVTDKATSLYLLPKEQFVRKFETIQGSVDTFGLGQLQMLAEYFQVSKKTAFYRLKECGIYVPVNI